MTGKLVTNRGTADASLMVFTASSDRGQLVLNGDSPKAPSGGSTGASTSASALLTPSILDGVGTGLGDIGWLADGGAAGVQAAA